MTDCEEYLLFLRDIPSSKFRGKKTAVFPQMLLMLLNSLFDEDAKHL